MRVRSFCAALASLALLVSAPAWSQSDMMTMTYDTDSGPLTLSFTQSSPDITGDYPDYDGHVSGKMISSDRIEGMWWQSKSSDDVTKCKEAMNGTYYWGKLVLTEDADQKGFHGKWGSCNDAPDGNWNGKLKN